jgi:subtilisin family serine protease
VVHVTRVVGGATPAEPTGTEFEIPHEPTDGKFVVGVIDTGFIEGSDFDWLDHVHFEGAVDPVAAEGILHLDDGHGTFVTGLILQEAPRATVKMLRALDANSDDVRQGHDQKVAYAIDKLGSDLEVKIISLSFFGGPWEHEPPEGIQASLEALRSRREDVVVVAAAGNYPDGKKVWPGAFEHVIAVGAVDESPRHPQGSPPPGRSSAITETGLTPMPTASMSSARS